MQPVWPMQSRVQQYLGNEGSLLLGDARIDRSGALGRSAVPLVTELASPRTRNDVDTMSWDGRGGFTQVRGAHKWHRLRCMQHPAAHLGVELVVLLDEVRGDFVQPRQRHVVQLGSVGLASIWQAVATNTGTTA